MTAPGISDPGCRRVQTRRAAPRPPNRDRGSNDVSRPIASGRLARWRASRTGHLIQGFADGPMARRGRHPRRTDRTTCSVKYGRPYATTGFDARSAAQRALSADLSITQRISLRPAEPWSTRDQPGNVTYHTYGARRQRITQASCHHHPGRHGDRPPAHRCLTRLRPVTERAALRRLPARLRPEL
jgi:hypothetical protein